MDPHLFLDGVATHAVALARGVLCRGQEFRDEEQRDPFHALGRVGQLGQHEVDNVLGQVVLTRRDEDFLPGQREAAVALGLGLGLDQAQIGAAMRLGQAHGAGPLARVQLGQVLILLLFGAVQVDGVVTAVAQPRVHAEGHVGRDHHFLDHELQRMRQAGAAVFRVGRQRGKAVFAVLVVGFLEPGRGPDHAVFQRAAFTVTSLVQGQQLVLGELRGLVQHGVDQVGRGILVTLVGAQLGSVPELVQDELHILERRVVSVGDWHLCLLSLLAPTLGQSPAGAEGAWCRATVIVSSSATACWC